MGDPDLNLRHLQLELSRIDVLLRRELLRWQRAGQSPADDFRGLYLSDEQAASLMERPLGASWGQTVALSPEEKRDFAAAFVKATREAERMARRMRQQNTPPRLDVLTAVCGLDRFERDVFLLCLAPALDLRYRWVYGYLQDDITRRYPTVNLALDLLGEPAGVERLSLLARFADDAPLFRWRLLEKSAAGDEHAPLLAHALHPDAGVVSWLLGDYRPGGRLAPYARLLPPGDADEFPPLLLTDDSRADLERAVAGPEPPLIVLHGPDETARQAAAHFVADCAGQPLLRLDLGAVVADGQKPRVALELTVRDAALVGALPYITGWDAVLTGGVPRDDLLTILCDQTRLAIVSGRQDWRAQGVARDKILLWMEFPKPGYARRRRLWAHFVERYLGRPPADLALDVDAPAGQFVLTGGQIRDAVATARDDALRRGGRTDSAALFAAARLHSSPNLAHLARQIVPRYTWEDIILPPDQMKLLREIVATVRHRPQVLEEWGVGRKLAAGAGTAMLFAGEPGTGKTMAAEVIAADLALDLYRIDLSTVVSKYIGETEKNLERIFSEAQNSNAILFFDEADALFGKRSEVRDAHDRYANIEVGYLLQRMEAYDGITILATNLRANLDEAFTRRLQFIVEFPFPEEEYRRRIWETLFPPDVPRAPDVDLPFLARRFRLAGGSIRNIIVNAAFLAAADGGPVTMAHLLHSTRRELQKMGRLVNERDLAWDDDGPKG